MRIAEIPLEVDQRSETTIQDRQHELGQFFTPSFVAEFMASLFEANWQELDLLDAGAGGGALSTALVKRLCISHHRPKRISITAYELDSSVINTLEAHLHECRRICESVKIHFSASIFNDDFITAAVPLVRGDLFASHKPRFNAAIVNPPYRKIRSDSATRLLLRSANIEASNLYTGFVALITQLLATHGELVAITPRSFCNGPYFKSFRSDFLRSMSLRRLHVFESRSEAFHGDDVLQENIIFHAIKGVEEPETVTISSSTGSSGSSVTKHQVQYQEVVSPDDEDQFIHIAESGTNVSPRKLMGQLSASLSDLGLSVSTGRVVDFRAKEFLRIKAAGDTSPLIYPCHFNGGFVHWPKEHTRKPNAIVCNEQTRELLVPAGIYVLVKRFTTKEERRRIVACIYDSHKISAPFVGFENHLNYFHLNGKGFTMLLAKGLAAFLNSTIVDAYFRQFNGHTQVNATDLRSLTYPSKVALEDLGRKIKDPALPQDDLDILVEEEFFNG